MMTHACHPVPALWHWRQEGQELKARLLHNKFSDSLSSLSWHISCRGDTPFQCLHYVMAYNNKRFPNRHWYLVQKTGLHDRWTAGMWKLFQVRMAEGWVFSIASINLCGIRGQKKIWHFCLSFHIPFSGFFLTYKEIDSSNLYILPRSLHQLTDGHKNTNLQPFSLHLGWPYLSWQQLRPSISYFFS